MGIDNIKLIPVTPGASSSNPSIVEGAETVRGQTVVLIADTETHQLLEGILIELKKLNLRQQEVFNETVNDEDVL